MAFEYKGWLLGFTLDNVNLRGQHWCQLTKNEVAMLLFTWDSTKGAGQAVAKSHMTTYLMEHKKITERDAQQISEWLIKLSEGKVSV